MYCAYCGNKLEDTDTFCFMCGAKTGVVQSGEKNITDTVEVVYGEEFNSAAKAVEGGKGAHLKKKKSIGWAIAGIAAAAAVAAIILSGSRGSKLETGDKTHSDNKIKTEEKLEKPEAVKADTNDSAEAEPLAAYENDVPENEDEANEAEEKGNVANSKSYILNFEGDTASIKITDVSINEDGFLSVTISSEAIIGALIRNNSLIIPYQAAVIVDGEEINWNKASISTGAYVFVYETDKLPETVILYSHGNRDSGIEVSYAEIFSGFNFDFNLDKFFN